MDPRGTVGRIYKEDHYTLLHTKYKSFGPCGFVEEDFFVFPHCKSMEDNDPRGGAIFDPRGMVGRIYKEDHYILLHTKYESSGPCGFGEDFFSSPEPSGSQGELIVYPCSVVRPSVVHHFQRSSPLKPLGQSKSNFT